MAAAGVVHRHVAARLLVGMDHERQVVVAVDERKPLEQVERMGERPVGVRLRHGVSSQMC